MLISKTLCLLCQIRIYIAKFEKYLWFFFLFQIPDDRYASNETHSRLIYQPEDEDDFGILYCRAVNLMGKMDAPCTFQLIPAGQFEL